MHFVVEDGGGNRGGTKQEFNKRKKKKKPIQGSRHYSFEPQLYCPYCCCCCHCHFDMLVWFWWSLDPPQCWQWLFCTCSLLVGIRQQGGGNMCHCDQGDQDSQCLKRKEKNPIYHHQWWPLWLSLSSFFLLLRWLRTLR